MTTRIFHLSDPHFGVENRSALAEFASAVRAERPDLVLCTGDLTQRATHGQFAEAGEFFAGLGTRVVLCAGNHDMPYYNLWERFTDPYRRFRQLYAEVGSEFASDDLVLVPLKTTVRVQPRFPWSDGYVRSGALEATIHHLGRLTGDTRLKIVTCHHPLLPAREAERNPTIGGNDAFAAIAGAGADAVVSGHVHIPFDLRRSAKGAAVRMIGAGTLSTRLRGAPPGYNVLTCSRDSGIEVEQRVVGES